MNPAVQQDSLYSEGQILSLRRGLAARRDISTWPGYAPTPLRTLDALASRLGVEAIYYKDESARFGLKSFKALGGAYAVSRLLQHALSEVRDGRESVELFSEQARKIASSFTVACATDGNHGRSVAWGAQTFGCQCVIFLHEGVSAAREAAIAAYGARIVRTPGNYDDSVRAASRAAQAHGWHVVSDTSYPGYLSVPRDVMQGYSTLMFEVEQQLPLDRLPTHGFIQGGVGGLAAAVCAHWWERHGTSRPRLIVVEPDAADCLYRSAEHGEPVALHGALNTVMAMLACGEVSSLAWDVLSKGAHAFMRIDDEVIAPTMRLLAAQHIVGGESGVAGLAALTLAAQDATMRERLGLNGASRVFVIGTEGDTDPALYRELVEGSRQLA